MPRIHEGFKRRLGTAEKREYTRIKQKESTWADYDAGIIKDDLIVLDDIPKLRTLSSFKKPLQTRRKRIHQLISLNDDEFKLYDMTINTLKPPAVVTATTSTATAVSTVSPEENLSPTSLSHGIVSILHHMSTPIQIAAPKAHSPNTDQSEESEWNDRMGIAAANTNNLQTAELYNGQRTSGKTATEWIDFDLPAIQTPDLDKQKKKLIPQDMIRLPSPAPVPGDRVFDISDAIGEQTTFEESKLLDSKTEKQQLQDQLDSLTEKLTKENEGQERILPLEERLHDAIRQVKVSMMLQEQLKRQVNTLTHEVQRWRRKASKIRCKVLELQQKEIQLSRVQKSLGLTFPRHPGSRPSHSLQQPSWQKEQSESVPQVSVTETVERAEFLQNEQNGRGVSMRPTNSLMGTESDTPCVATRRSPQVRLDTLLIGNGHLTTDQKHDRFASCSETVVAEDPYSINSESD